MVKSIVASQKKKKIKKLELKKSKPSRAPKARGEASEVFGSRRSPSPDDDDDDDVQECERRAYGARIGSELIVKTR